MDEFANTPALIEQSFAVELPFNRKERFFTATVLPAIVTCDNFAHFDRFLDLCGVQEVLGEPDAHVAQSIADDSLQFYTEYSFPDSVFTDEHEALFPLAQLYPDTPDIVVRAPGWLLAVEAKLYSRPNRGALETQLVKQRALVTYWGERLIGSPTVQQVALLPAAVAAKIPDLSVKVVTWEDIADRYRDVAPQYWIKMLDKANAYDGISSGTSKNGHGFRTGSEIADMAAGNALVNAAFTTMGRAGGLEGVKLAGDIGSGGWRDQPYQVRGEGIPNSNWFTIDAFVARLAAAGQL